MKGFIEVTESYRNKTVSVSVANIKYVQKDDEETFIVFFGVSRKNIKKPWCSLGMAVKESYDEVLAKIKEATD